MLLFSHITIALAGLGLGTYSYFKLSKKALLTTYLLGVGTLLTGIWLLAQQPSHLMSTCMTGLAYYAVLSGIVIAARRRLAFRLG